MQRSPSRHIKAPGSTPKRSLGWGLSGGGSHAKAPPGRSALVGAGAWVSTRSGSGCTGKKTPVPLGFCLALSSPLSAGQHGPVRGAHNAAAAAAMAASE